MENISITDIIVAALAALGAVGISLKFTSKRRHIQQKGNLVNGDLAAGNIRKDTRINTAVYIGENGIKIEGKNAVYLGENAVNISGPVVVDKKELVE